MNNSLPVVSEEIFSNTSVSKEVLEDLKYNHLWYNSLCFNTRSESIEVRFQGGQLCIIVKKDGYRIEIIDVDANGQVAMCEIVCPDGSVENKYRNLKNCQPEGVEFGDCWQAVFNGIMKLAFKKVEDKL